MRLQLFHEVLGFLETSLEGCTLCSLQPIVEKRDLQHRYLPPRLEEVIHEVLVLRVWHCRLFLKTFEPAEVTYRHHCLFLSSFPALAAAPRSLIPHEYAHASRSRTQPLSPLTA